MANRKTLTLNGVNFSLLTGKQAEALVDEYRRAERKGNTYLWEVYGRCSYAKERAWEDCNAIRGRLGGGCMYISGHNCMQFSLVYMIRWSALGNEKCYIVKETHCNRYIAEVNIGALR